MAIINHEQLPDKPHLLSSKQEEKSQLVKYI